MRALRRWIRRIRQFAQPHESTRELDEELQFHLEHRIQENVDAGMDPAAARQGALRQFGGVEQIKEQCRDVQGIVWLDRWMKDIHFAWRTLKKRPGFTFAAAVTLGLGVGGNTAVFSALNAVLFRPLPYAEPDRLVQVVETNKWRGDYFAVAPGNLLDWREQNNVLEDIVPYMKHEATLMAEGNSYRVPGIRATAAYFTTLGVRPQLGRWFTAEEDYPTPQPVVVMSHDLWMSRFGGDTNLVGTTIQIDGQSHIVVGVMPVGFRHFSRYFGSSDVALWFPDPFREDSTNDRNIHRLGAVARLKQGVTLSRAQGEMSLIAKRLEADYPESNESAGVRLIPLHADLVEDSRGQMFLFIGITSFVLLIACVNVATLFLSRAAARQREIALRISVGADRVSIVRMLLTEGMVVGCLAATAGFIFAEIGAQLIRAFDPGSIPRLSDAGFDWRVLGFMLGLSVFSGLAAATTPALQFSRPNLTEALKGDTRVVSGAAPSSKLRSLFVVVQTAITLILLCGAGLMVNTLVRLLKVDPGFETKGLLVADLGLPKHQFLLDDGTVTTDGGPVKVWKLRPEASHALSMITERLSQLKGVDAAAVVDHLPMSGYGGWPMWFKVLGELPAGMPEEAPFAYERTVTPGYFKTLGLRLLKGRLLKDSDTESSPISWVINEAGANEYWPDKDPIGQRIQFVRGAVGATNLAEIVGVVSNTRHEPAGKIEPELYVHYPQIEKRYVPWQVGFRLGPEILVRTRMEPRRLVESLRQIVGETDPAITVANCDSMRQRIAGTFKQQQRLAGFLMTFSILALILAAVGIHAVVAYSVRQRIHELGLRLALGGTRRSVRNRVLRQGMTPVLLGVLLGILGAIGLTRLIANQLFGIQPLDPLTYAVVIAGWLMVSALACLLPTNRILSLEPWDVLRNE